MKNTKHPSSIFQQAAMHFRGIGFLLFLTGILLSPNSIQGQCAVCGPSGYGYLVKIAVDNPTPNPLQAYQVAVEFNSATLISQGKMQASGADIRFTDDCNLLIPHWLERDGLNTALTRVWVRVPLIPAMGSDTIYFHYGNPTALATDNGDAVFEFFDDFNGNSLNTAKWNSTGISTSVSGSVLDLSSPSADAGIAGKVGVNTNTGYGYSITYRVKMNDIVNSNFINFGICTDSTNPWNTRTGCYGYKDANAGRIDCQVNMGGSMDCTNNLLLIDLNWHRFTTNLNLGFDIDGLTPAWCTGSGTLVFAGVGTWVQGASGSIDWVYLRKRVIPEVILTNGSEQPSSTFSVAVQTVSPNCAGALNGSATAAGQGGTPPYTYAWGPAAGNQTGPVAIALGAGNYSLTVTDAPGCSMIYPFSLSSPPALLATGSSTDATCFGLSNGSATLSPGGGTPPYSFAWDANAGNQTSQTATNLSNGNYSVTLTDSNGCTLSQTVAVGSPPAISLNFNVTPPTCPGDSDGGITTIAGGGTGNLSYLWGPNAGNSVNSFVSGLSGGAYALTLTDSLGCTHRDTAIVVDPPAIQLSLSSTPTATGLCTGTASVTASGGTPPYTYLWNDSASQNTATATGLCQGNYTVTITDANGCTVTGTIQIESGVGLEEILPQSVRIFPNPNTGSFRILLPDGMLPDAVLIYDRLGKEIYLQTPSIHEGNILIELKGVAVGIYFLKIQAGRQVLTGKLMVM